MPRAVARHVASLRIRKAYGSGTGVPKPQKISPVGEKKPESTLTFLHRFFESCAYVVGGEDGQKGGRR